MSLINNMLKNLESREQPTATISYLPFRKPVYWHYYRYWFVGLLLVIAIFSSLLLLNLSRKTAPRYTFELPQLGKSEFRVPDNTWLQTAKITGITLKETGSQSELTFLLSNPTLYSLYVPQKQNAIILSFDQSVLDAQLPNINHDSVGLSALTFLRHNGLVVFKLELKPNVLLKSVRLTETNPPELMVTLEELPSTNLDNASIPFLKTPAMDSLLNQQYEKAIRLAETGDYAKAITELDKLLHVKPEMNEVRSTLSALLIDQGNIAQAEKILDLGLIIAPNYLQFIELKSRILSIRGEHMKALALLQQHAPVITDNPEYYAFMAALYEQSNNDLLAVKIYKQLLALQPENSNWWFGLAVSLDKLGEETSAKQTYQRALLAGHLDAESATYIQKRLKSFRVNSNATR